MLKSEMQHQFWITKKTVQRKFGSKEDEHIISSDAELDAKIEVFRSISATSMELSKIIDQYQERLCMLSQEETMFGRFLKEAGKRSKTTSQAITSAGKAVSYCGQQRMCVRVPLLRLQHEIDVFRYRAITDMQNTITVMEKERTEYRAALEWMKSASTELDPDTGRGLHKFRTAQTHVRNAKQHFDSLTMDSIQKIDLLAAARCNMFSHVLVSYMTELRQFAQKTNTTFDAISKILEHKPKYDFYILKELIQQEGNQENIDNDYKTSLLDKDQSLYFAEDYMDNDLSSTDAKSETNPPGSAGDDLVSIYNNSEGVMNFYGKNQIETATEESGAVECKSSDVLLEMLNTKVFNSTDLTPTLPTHSFGEYPTELKNQCFQNETMQGPNKLAPNDKLNTNKNLRPNPWLELFGDLDPLANLEAFDLKLSGSCKNFQQT